MSCDYCDTTDCSCNEVNIEEWIEANKERVEETECTCFNGCDRAGDVCSYCDRISGGEE